MVVDDDVALTATIDILRAIADGAGPRNRLLALGYAGWGPGQLDSEILHNGWLNVSADDDLVFGEDLDAKWERAMAKIGIDPLLLSDDAGHA
jgi:putative transcriptional regulator